MTSWRDIATQNRSAAIELFALRRWRGCVNRAYFAVYSEVTHALLAVPVTMPAGRQAPNHLTLPNLVNYNLMGLGGRNRWRLSGLVKKLYDLRCVADYRRLPAVAEADSRVALSLMEKAFNFLQEIS